MKGVTRQDLKIIASVAFQMAQRDAKMHKKEIAFLQNIVKAGNFSKDELTEIRAASNIDVAEVAKTLTSNRAKKLLLLTVSSVALADGIMDGAEREFLDDLSRKLKVGSVNLNDHTSEECEKMALKIIAGE